MTSSAISRPAPGAMPKPWPLKPVAMKNPGSAVDAGNHRDGVRRDVDHAAPAVRDAHGLENREGIRHVDAGLLQDRLMHRRVQNPHRLERRGAVQIPARRLRQFLEEPAAEAQFHVASLHSECGKEVAEKSE